MTQGSLAAALEQGEAADGGKASTTRTWPDLQMWQWAIVVAFVHRMGSGFLVPDRAGEAQPEMPYFQPFFLAFFIWPVIYLFAGAFTVWQFLQKPGVASDRRLAAIQGVAPWWCAMSLITVAWNFAPNLWLAGVALSEIAICLLFAHGVVAGELESPDYYLINVPLTMHLGWGTAAALLTWNNVVAESTSSLLPNLAALGVSLALAAGLSTFFALRRRSSLLAWTVAWAVAWIGVMTLFPFPAATLEKYNAELGVTGRYILGAAELALSGCLIAVGCVARKRAQQA